MLLGFEVFCMSILFYLLLLCFYVQFCCVLFFCLVYATKFGEIKRLIYNKITPTRAALFQHVLRAAYQAGNIWGQALVQHARLTHPNKWAGKKEQMGH